MNALGPNIFIAQHIPVIDLYRGTSSDGDIAKTHNKTAKNTRQDGG